MKPTVHATALLLGLTLAAASPVSSGQEGGAAALSQRHSPSGRNSAFILEGADLSLPYATYVERMRAIVAETRADRDRADFARIVDLNAPFEWRPDPARCESLAGGALQSGVLLVHGLTDSPFLMQDVGRHFLDRCFLVRGLLLPGHGTVPGDLLDLGFGEWLEAVRYGIASFGDEVEKLYVVGFSTGAAAALHNQLSRDPTAAKVNALVLLSPAVAVKSKFAFAANWHKLRALLVKLDVKSRADYEQRRWIDLAADADYAKYESFPKNAGDQIYLLTKAIADADAKALGTPLFMAVSEHDDTVDAAAAIALFEETPSPLSRLIVYGDCAAREETDSRARCRPHADPDLGILDYSHTAIPVSPDNAHYGRAGDYRNCMHYLGDGAKWDACKSGAGTVKLGEKTEDNLERHTVQRLTFNPDFANLLREIDAFVDGL